MPVQWCCAHHSGTLYSMVQLWVRTQHCVRACRSTVHNTQFEYSTSRAHVDWTTTVRDLKIMFPACWDIIPACWKLCLQHAGLCYQHAGLCFWDIFRACGELFLQHCCGIAVADRTPAWAISTQGATWAPCERWQGCWRSLTLEWAAEK